VPELPDLHYIVTHLAGRIENRRIDEVVVKEPIVIRMLLPGAGGFVAALQGRRIESLARHGPFLAFGLSDHAELIVHCMLAGRLQIAAAGEKPVPHLCFSLRLDDGEWLRYGDDKRMGKVYLTAAGSHEPIPGYDEQGVDVLSESFTFEMFEKLIRGRRHQARVFLMDQSVLSAIGNAYADEILFAARIHPKTACSSLTAEERRGLHDAIRSVMDWGIAEVEKAGMPIEVKVRDHMQVRGRKDQPCPRCGAKIRRAGVLGYDSFYCPSCQPATRKQPIPWDVKNPPSTSARKET
jgi:formamidopyrimidine-DNA glycosylase